MLYPSWLPVEQVRYYESLAMQGVSAAVANKQIKDKFGKGFPVDVSNYLSREYANERKQSVKDFMGSSSGRVKVSAAMDTLMVSDFNYKYHLNVSVKMYSNVLNEWVTQRVTVGFYTLDTQSSMLGKAYTVVQNFISDSEEEQPEGRSGEAMGYSAIDWDSFQVTSFHKVNKRSYR